MLKKAVEEKPYLKDELMLIRQQIRNHISAIIKVIQGNPLERRWRQDGVSPADTQEALKLLRQLSSRFLYGK